MVIVICIHRYLFFMFLECDRSWCIAGWSAEKKAHALCRISCEKVAIKSRLQCVSPITLTHHYCHCYTSLIFGPNTTLVRLFMLKSQYYCLCLDLSSALCKAGVTLQLCCAYFEHDKMFMSQTLKKFNICYLLLWYEATVECSTCALRIMNYGAIKWLFEVYPLYRPLRRILLY